MTFRKKKKKPAEKKGFHEEQYFFFFLWDFFFFFGLFFLPHIFSPLKRTQDDGGFILYTLSGCASALDPSNQPTHSILEGTLWTHHLVVKLKKKRKKKHWCTVHLPMNFEKLFFLFQLSFNRFTTVVCLYNVTFCIFMCEKNTQGPRQFEFQLENIWDI